MAPSDTLTLGSRGLNLLEPPKLSSRKEITLDTATFGRVPKGDEPLLVESATQSGLGYLPYRSIRLAPQNYYISALPQKKA